MKASRSWLRRILRSRVSGLTICIRRTLNECRDLCLFVLLFVSWRYKAFQLVFPWFKGRFASLLVHP